MRTLLRAAFWAICVIYSGYCAAAEGPRPSETYLPKTTAAVLSVADPEKLIEDFKKTQIGQLVQDPVMEPFIKDIQRQFEDRINNLKDHLAITLDDLRGVSGGEAALAAIRPAPGESAVALVADVTGHIDAAKDLLKKISANLTEEGAKKNELTVGDVTVLIFDLPKPKGDDRDTEGQAKPKKTEARQAVYCLVGALLMASDRQDVIEGMLNRVPKERGDALADLPSFKYVVERCRKDLGDETPQIRWFIQPLSYIDVLYTNTPPHKRRKGKDPVKMMQEQGFTAIQGVGGSISVAAEKAEFLHRTTIHAPKPWTVSMELVAFQPGKDFAPQKWVPREIATYNTLYFDILKAFDNFGPLYSEFTGLKDKDAWKEAIKGLAEDPNGPMVHLRNQLCAHLGPRITVVSDYQVPITPTSERLLFALETNNPEAVAKSIEKLMKAEENVKRHEIDGHIIWEMTPPAPTVEAPVVTLPSIGGPSGDDAGGGKKDDEEEEQKVKVLPHAAITVAHGHLFCASHLDFLLKILKTAKQPDPVDHEAGFLAVQEMLDSFGMKDKCAQTFSFTDEEVRPTYELIRMNKLPEAETMLARALNTLSGETKKGEFRKRKIDGSELPDYDVVRRCLGPAGMVAAQEKEGWFLKGCLLKKE